MKLSMVMKIMYLDDKKKLILNNLSKENYNNEIENLLLKYQTIFRDITL